MSDITLVRQDPIEISEADKATARRVLFGIVDGLGEKGKGQWRRFFNRLMKLEPGEMVEIKTHQERIGWYHRKHMALEQAIFESQERFDNFKGFRDWLKVGAGHCVFPVPKTISYSKLEQAEMEEFHVEAVKFLRTEHAGATLWKHLQPMARVEMLEITLASFHE